MMNEGKTPGPSSALLEKELTWKAQGQQIDLLVSSANKADCAGVLYQRKWARSERVKRAGRVLAVLWLGAVVSIFIPVAHFLLVPLFLLAGPLAGIWYFRIKESWLGGFAKCPACEAYFELLALSNAWPLHDVCKECDVQVRIKKA